MFEFKLPDLGEGIHEGELIKWHVKEGDRIDEDDPLCDMETDKAMVTIPSPRSGVIIRLNGNPGDTITVNTVLVAIDENNGETSIPDRSKPNGPAVPAVDTEKPRTIAAPATRRFAREMKINIKEVSGTGPGGRVTKEDLKEFAAKNIPSSEPKPWPAKFDDSPPASLSGIIKPGIPFFEIAPLPDYEAQGPVLREPMRSLRKKTATITTSSMILIPHVAHMDECDVTELETLRKDFNSKNKKESKLTLLAFVIKALASLLRLYPAFNASIDPGKLEIIYKKFFHIGFAADTPKGLMVPVIKDADQKSITQLAKQIRHLAQKGREGTITLPEISHGTFTVTNVGAIGGTGMVPTINYPESAILGMGRVTRKPVVKDDAIVIRQVLPVTLCFDHRVADGAQAARFVRQLKQMLEDPLVFMTGI